MNELTSVNDQRLKRRGLKTPSAADYVGKSISWMTKARLLGSGPFYYKLGRSVIYMQDDLDAWLNENRRRSTSDEAGRAAQ
jgi:hypothetical protein